MKCAIVDLGSNTIRLSLYNTLRMADLKLYFLRNIWQDLPDMFLTESCLTMVSIRLVLYCLISRFFLQQLGVKDMHVFATASLRNIKNTEKALETIKRRTGLSVDVIEGSEEGILGYYGALYTTDLKNGMMFDIGGGSTEFVRVKNGKVKIHRVSLSVPSIFSTVTFPVYGQRKRTESNHKTD